MYVCTNVRCYACTHVCIYVSMYLDKATLLTTNSRGHLDEEARDEDHVDQSKSTTRKRPSREERAKRKTGRARAITEEEEKRKARRRRRRGGRKGRHPRAQRTEFGPTPPPLRRHLRPRGETKKGDAGLRHSRPRRPTDPFGSRGGQGLDAPSPPLLEETHQRA